MTSNHIKTLYVLNALLVCAVLAFFFFYIHAPQISSGTGPIGSGIVPPGRPLADQATVAVGNSADNPAANRIGLITQISGNTLTVKDSSSGEVYTITTNSDTAVVLVGPQKDPVAYQKELDAYYAQVKQLVQDPIKNKIALGALTIPDSAELTQ